MKKRHTLNKVNESEADQLNQNFDDLFRGRVARGAYNESGTFSIHNFQFIESGILDFSATGSATVTKIVSLTETYNKVLFSMAQSKNTDILANITDVTATAATITIRSVSATAISGVTTGTISVNYLLIGSNP